MLNYIIRRILWLPLLLLIVTFLTFSLGVYGPGGPANTLMGPKTDPEVVARLEHEWGLDRPFIVQYLNYLGRLARLDFGESLVKYRGQPILIIMVPRLLITIQLNVASALLGVPMGIALGMLAALKRGTWIDRAVVGVVVAGISVPVYVLAPPLLYLGARVFKVLPPGGWDGLFSMSALLPVVVLAMGPMAVFARQTRAGLLEVMRQDYIRTARAKGLTQKLIVLRHAMRNAFIPLITILGFLLGGLVDGAILTEAVFDIPGMGQLAFDAFIARDYPIIMTLTLLVAVAYALANLWVDMTYGIIDPRLRG